MNATDLEALLRLRRQARQLPPPPLRRMLRQQAGLSQSDVAGLLGVSPPAVSRWEAGRRTPRGDLATAYAAVLDRLAVP